MLKEKKNRKKKPESRSERRIMREGEVGTNRQTEESALPRKRKM
jgi:hypothetical protein